MKRSQFLTTLAATTLLPLRPWALGTASTGSEWVQPQPLQPGDTLAITAPAGYATRQEVEAAQRVLESWGFTVRLGNTVGKRFGTFSGTDAERAADLQQLLAANEVKAILCARGGYGAVRIVDKVDFSLLCRRPKWLIGFSDITLLHCHIHRHCGVATLHAKMSNGFPENWALADAVQQATLRSIRDALMGLPSRFELPPHTYNRTGEASGVLVGGNLRTLETLAGTRSDIPTKGKILFLEDTGEYLYSIDRMFWNLKRSGKLDELAGLLIGGFNIKRTEDPNDEFGMQLREIVLEKTEGCNYPVCFNFPVGHQKSNYALKCGVRHHLSVTASGVVLKEI